MSKNKSYLQHKFSNNKSEISILRKMNALLREENEAVRLRNAVLVDENQVLRTELKKVTIHDNPPSSNPTS